MLYLLVWRFCFETFVFAVCRLWRCVVLLWVFTIFDFLFVIGLIVVFGFIVWFKFGFGLLNLIGLLIYCVISLMFCRLGWLISLIEFVFYDWVLRFVVVFVCVFDFMYCLMVRFWVVLAYWFVLFWCDLVYTICLCFFCWLVCVLY